MIRNQIIKKLLLNTLPLLVVLGALFVVTLFLLQQQNRRNAELAATDISTDLAHSDITSAFRKLYLYQRTSDFELTPENETIKLDGPCLSSMNIPVIVDGITLGRLHNCLTPARILSGVRHSPEALLLWLVVLGSFLAFIQAKARFQAIRLRNKKNEEVAQLSRQVAHDVRSPLSALNLVASKLQELPDEKRQLIVTAAERIRDIVDDLLAKGHNKSPSYPLVNLNKAVDEIFREKRHLSNLNFEIQVTSKFCSIPINKIAIQRALSNVINNSVEALQNEGGKITLLLEASESQVSITVSDNGSGIPNEYLSKLGHKPGLSFAKKYSRSGYGLGLFQSRSAIMESGGQFVIESRTEDPSGTQVRFIFPLTESKKIW